MNYIQRNLLPLTIGLLACVAIVIGIGTVAVRVWGGDQISDEQFDRELGRRLDGAFRGTLGLQLDDALRVSNVAPNSPASAVGIQVGDRIVAINGAEVKTIDDARARLAAVARGSDYTITANRDGKQVDLNAKKAAAGSDLGGLFQRVTQRAPPVGRPGATARPAPEASPAPAVPPAQGPTLGISIQPVTGGLRVIAVTPNSPASSAGLLAEDVIVSANGRITTNLDALQNVLQTAGSGGVVTLNVQRNGQQVTLTAQLVPRA